MEINTNNTNGYNFWFIQLFLNSNTDSKQNKFIVLNDLQKDIFSYKI